MKSNFKFIFLDDKEKILVCKTDIIEGFKRPYKDLIQKYKGLRMKK